MSFRSDAAHGVLLPALLLSTAIGLFMSPATAETTENEIAALRRELRAQQEITRKLAQRLDAVSSAAHNAKAANQHEIKVALDRAKADLRAQAPTQLTTTVTGSNTTTPAVKAGFKLGDSPRGISGYKSGFFVEDASGDNTLYINGLLQPRYRYFAPSGTEKFGAKDQASNNFDVFLGRLYFSGNIVDPSFTYFFTLQGTTPEHTRGTGNHSAGRRNRQELQPAPEGGNGTLLECLHL